MALRPVGTIPAARLAELSAWVDGQRTTEQVVEAAQAIGQACGANPIPILIPCHRVLSASGLGGFSGAGGVETKVALLRLEGAGSLLL